MASKVSDAEHRAVLERAARLEMVKAMSAALCPASLSEHVEVHLAERGRVPISKSVAVRLHAEAATAGVNTRSWAVTPSPADPVVDELVAKSGHLRVASERLVNQFRTEGDQISVAELCLAQSRLPSPDSIGSATWVALASSGIHRARKHERSLAFF